MGKKSICTTLLYLLGLSSIIAQNPSAKPEFLKSFTCNSDTITFSKQIVPLKENEGAFSSLDGRFLLIASNPHEIIHKFYEIGGYSSGFIGKSSIILTDFSDNSKADLILKIKPHEAMPFFSFFIIENCKFTHIKNIEGYKYSISDGGIIQIENYAACDGWTECVAGTMPRLTEISTIIRHDFYKYKDGQMIRVHPQQSRETYKSLIQLYQNFHSQLSKAKSSDEWTQFDWYFDSKISKVDDLIEEYKSYLAKL